MPLAERKVMLCLLTIIICLVLVHWFLTFSNELSQMLLRVYIHRDPASGKGLAGYFDLVLPSILMGLSVGLFGRRFSSKKLYVLVVVAGISLALLSPVFMLFLNSGQAWWWPKTTQGVIIGIAVQSVKGALLVGISAYFGREIGAYFDKRQQ